MLRKVEGRIHPWNRKCQWREMEEGQSDTASDEPVTQLASLPVHQPPAACVLKEWEQDLLTAGGSRDTTTYYHLLAVE